MVVEDKELLKFIPVDCCLFIGFSVSLTDQVMHHVFFVHATTSRALLRLRISEDIIKC